MRSLRSPVSLLAGALIMSLAAPCGFASAAEEALPKYGEYVPIDELPEVVHRTAPRYPPQAKEAGLEGTVIVQTLVGKDGRVKDVRVAKSIPVLDQAAVEAVRQWVFKPALVNNQPVAVWIAVPVKFTLHHGLEPARISRDTATHPPPILRPPARGRNGPPLSDLLAALRARGVQPPSEDDALLRERIIRATLSMEPRPDLPPAARQRFDLALKSIKEGRQPAEILSELAATLHEAPWWPVPYREIARVQERLHQWEDAIVSLELYLVAAPEADDWERVRFDLKRLRGKLTGSQ